MAYGRALPEQLGIAPLVYSTSNIYKTTGRVRGGVEPAGGWQGEKKN